MKKLFLLSLSAFVILQAVEVVNAAQVTVNNGLDVSTNGGSVCTLREALATSDAGVDLGNGCTLVDDGNAETTILFSVSSVVLTQGALSIKESVTINSSDSSERVEIVAAPGKGVFDIDRVTNPFPVPARSFTFNHLEISDSDLNVVGSTQLSQIDIAFGFTAGLHRVVFRGCLFQNNKTNNNAVAKIVALNAGSNPDVDIIDTHFIGNEGGAVFVNLADLTTEGATFLDNSGEPSGFGGGALTAIKSNVTIRDSEFKNNTSIEGGAIYARETSSPTEETVSSLEIYDSLIDGNIATSPLGGTTGGGGGIRALTLDSGRIQGTTISNNISATVGGGVRYLSEGDPLIVEDSIISGNQATTDGGGISARVMKVDNVRVIGNTAGARGGGMRISGQSGVAEPIPAEVTNSTFKDNQATGDGGGLWLDGLGHTVVGSTFSNNSGAFGGGIFFNTAANENEIKNSTFSGNHATESGGGVTFFSADGSKINNSTFTQNSAQSEAGGIFVNLSPGIEITNTIVANSSATIFPNARDCSHVGSLPVSMSNSLVQDGGCNVTNLGGIQADPILSEKLNDNGGSTETHMLLIDSPAKNTADNASCEATDQRGQPRPDPESGLCDMGAFEIQQGEGVETTDSVFFIIPTKNGSVTIGL